MKNEEKILVSKEQTWKGLKMELPLKELQKIFQQNFEKDQYFNFDILLNGMHKAFKKEVNFDYYTSWAVLIANCFTFTRFSNNKLNNLIDEIAWFFDGISFNDEWNRKKFLYDIACLKDFNHQFEDLLNKKDTIFATNGVERILIFDHANWTTDTCVMRVIIKDHNKKQFSLQYVDDNDFEYDENVNYQFVEEDKFRHIFNCFYDEEYADWEETHNLKF